MLITDRNPTPIILSLLATLALGGSLHAQQDPRGDGDGEYKDILVRVKETQTGSFMVGAGINSSAGLMGNIVLNECNFEAQVIAEVRVSGNKNIPYEQIMRYIHNRAGMELDKSRSYDDARRLMDSNLLKDVHVDIRKEEKGWTVTYNVAEWPNKIDKVVVRNAHHVSNADLEALMPDIRAGSPLNPVANKKAAQNLQNYLRKERGRYWANVVLEEGGKVTDRQVVFNVTEGPVLRIRSIQFVGGSSLASPARLGTVIGTQSSRPISFGIVQTNFMVPSVFSDATVDADVERLREYFVKNGYSNAKVVRELIFSPDFSQVDIVFHIAEGAREKADSVRFEKSMDGYIGWRGFDAKVNKEVWDSDNTKGLVTVQYTVEQQNPEPAKVGKIYIISGGGTAIRGVSIPDPTPSPNISSIAIEGNTTVPTEKVMNYLVSSRGATFDQELLAQDVRRLQESGLFQSVSEEHSATEDGVDVVLHVAEHPQVEDVIFENAYHFSNQELRRIAEYGGVKQETRPDAQANQNVGRMIRNELIAHGYHWAKVAVRQEERPSGIRVVFDVDEGPLVHIRSINFTGNKGIAKETLRAQADRVLAGSKAVLLPAALENVEVRLEDYCRSHGYRQAHVEHTVSFDHAYDEADVSWKIREGKRTRIKGWSLASKGVIAPAEAQPTGIKTGAFYDEDVLSRSTLAVAEAYRRLGRSVEVNWKIVEEGSRSDLVSVVFQIDEKPAAAPKKSDVVAAVVVEGNTTVPTAQVMSLLQTRPGTSVDDNVLHQDARRLFDSNLFQYVSMHRETSGDGVVVHVCLEKSPRPIEEVVYKNVRNIGLEQLEKLTRIRKGMPLDPVANLLACKEIQEYLKSKGRHWAKVTLEEGNRNTDQRVVFNIDEGPLVKIRSASFVGNKALESAVLTQQLESSRPCRGGLNIFCDAAVQGDVKKLEEFCRAKGYPSARVRRELTFTKDRIQVDIVYRVEEGAWVSGFHFEIVPNLIPDAGRSGFGGGGPAAAELAHRGKSELRSEPERQRGPWVESSLARGLGQESSIFLAHGSLLLRNVMPGKASTMWKIMQSAWTRALAAAAVLLVLVLCSRLAVAQQSGEIVVEVVIRGNTTIPSEQIMRYIHLRAGMDFNQSRVYDDANRLHESKLIKEVQPKTQKVSNGWVVTYNIYEWPNTVLEVIYKNVHHISQKDLEAMMPDVRKGQPLNTESNKTACRVIQESLKKEKGRYWASVTLEEGAKPTDRRVIFNVSEGPVLRVRGTSFVGGDKLASTPRLRTQISTSSAFLGLGGVFNDAVVDGDVKKLEDYFHHNGYLMAKVHRELIFSQDYSQVDVVFHIAEGSRYKVESVGFDLKKTNYTSNELIGALTGKPGTYFNENVAENDKKNLETYIGWRGFDAKVNKEVWESDKTKGLVTVQYTVEQQNPEPAKVGKIYVIGNEVTQDRVILRLLGLYPGQTLHYPEIKIGEANIMRSNLFEMKGEENKPSIEVVDPKGDGYGVYKDIMVRVKETQTGSFMIGAGINSNAGLMGNIVLNERNFDLFRVPTNLADVWEGRAFRGAGQEFRIEAVPGTLVQRYSATIREPFLFDRPYSLTTSAYFFERFYEEDTEERLGARVTLAHTFNNTWPEFFTRMFDGPVLSYLKDSRYAFSVNGGARIEEVTISGIVPFAPAAYQEAYGHHFVFGPTVGATLDSRNSFLRPTNGGIINASLEIDTGSYTYPLANITASRYFTLWERQDGSGKHVLSFRSQVSWAGSNTPVYDRYYAGGYGTLRGFQFRGVGPNVNNFEVGGDFMFLNNIEYQVPVLANDQLYFVAFVDSGTVESSVEIRNYRVSAGVGMRLAIPMLGPLPLAFDIGVPLVRGPDDHIEYIAFSVGFNH